MTHAESVTLGLILASACAPIVVGAAIVLRPMPPDMAPDKAMVFGSILFALIWGFPLALILNVCVALPSYLVLRRYGTMRRWHAALAGVVIGGALSTIDGISLAEFAVAGGAGLASGLAFAAAVCRESPAEAANTA